MQTDKVLAIDCGGTFIKAGLVSSQGEICEHRTLPTLPGRGLDTVLIALQKIIEDYRDQIQGVGIAYAGAVDPQEGRILEAPNFPKEWKTLPLTRILQERTGIPISLENDANLAAFGEYWKGAGKGIDVLVAMTLGTGVGGGIVIDGKIWNGATGIAAEIGHIPIAETGPLCGCGNVGCLEAYASSTAVVRMAQEMRLSGCPDLTAQAVYRLAKAGDPAARAIFAKVGRALGCAIVAVVHLIGPRRVIICGGGAGAWDAFHDEMVKTFQQKAFQREREIVQIVPGQLADQSGILGAAYLAFQKVNSRI